MSAELVLGGRTIGPDHSPLVVAEIGINHEGDFDKALRMVEDGARAGCECVKFQSHVVDDEMVPAARKVVPGNATVSIWEIMERCSFTEEQERSLKKYTEEKGMLYLSTPFSRAAADRLERIGVSAYKIGSGECNNYPLVEHIASFGKPVILSTGMNNLRSIGIAVNILRKADIPFGLLHCTSIYPTPYDKVHLGGISALGTEFPDAVLGLSDHSLGIYTSLAAVALGARILEKHFTSDRSWVGPDVPISIDPVELGDLVRGAGAVFEALGGSKGILPDEASTIAFAYASVVSTRPIEKGQVLSGDNVWVKRPGGGDFLAEHFRSVVGRRAARRIDADCQIQRADIEWESS